MYFFQPPGELPSLGRRSALRIAEPWFCSLDIPPAAVYRKLFAMKIFPLAAGAGLLGLTYLFWPQPAPQALPIAGPPPPAPPVPFLVKAKVKEIWEQTLKLRSATAAGDKDPAETRIQLAVQDIEESLARGGVHGRGATLEVVRAAAVECGFNEGQVQAVVSSFSDK